MSKDIRRREFLILAAAAALAGRKTVAKTASAERVVDAGPARGTPTMASTQIFGTRDSLPSAKAMNFLHFPRSARIGNVSCRPSQTDLSIASATDRPLIRTGR
jgi:hypothetical protein